MTTQPPAAELIAVLQNVPAGRALDLASGAGRHAQWLLARGWQVTAIDREQADLEKHEYAIEQGAWDLIVCWLYWQEDLMPEIAAGVRPGGLVALAGKTSGRFATSLDSYRAFLKGWTELAAGEDASKVFFIGRYNRTEP